MGIFGDVKDMLSSGSYHYSTTSYQNIYSVDTSSATTLTEEQWNKWVDSVYRNRIYPSARKSVDFTAKPHHPDRDTWLIRDIGGKERVVSGPQLVAMKEQGYTFNVDDYRTTEEPAFSEGPIFKEDIYKEDIDPDESFTNSERLDHFINAPILKARMELARLG